MTLLKHAITTVATLLVVLIIAGLLMPKTAHGLVATLVKDVQSPFGAPFFVEALCQFTNSGDFPYECNQPLLDAPGPGQVIKIEYVSLYCQLESTTFVKSVDIQSPYFSSDNFINVASPPVVPGLQTFAQQVTIYVTAGNPVRVLVDANQGSTGRCFVTLNGYKVNQ